MKDLTFIAEGNPDFFKGGLINLTKRRQVSGIFIYALSQMWPVVGDAYFPFVNKRCHF